MGGHTKKKFLFGRGGWWWGRGDSWMKADWEHLEAVFQRM